MESPPLKRGVWILALAALLAAGAAGFYFFNVVLLDDRRQPFFLNDSEASAVLPPEAAAPSARLPLRPSVVLAAFETTPAIGSPLDGALEDVPPRLAAFLRESASYPHFYTSDTRSVEALRGLFSTPWPQALREKGYRTFAVGAFTEDMKALLSTAGFETLHPLPHDGYDPIAATHRATEWARTNGRAPFVLFVYYRDLPRFRFAPARFWALSLHRIPRFPARWAFWRRETEAAYADDALGRLAENMNSLPNRPLFGVVSLHGVVLDESPVRWPRTGRRGKRFINEEGLGMRESEVRILFALRRPGRLGPDFIRNPGQISDVGPVLLNAAGAPRSDGRGRPGKGAGAPIPDESAGRWVVHSPWAKALIVDGRYKYIRHGGGRRCFSWAGGPARTDYPSEELFDLWNDPGERRNLIRSRRHLLSRLREVLGEADPDPVDVRLGFLNPAGVRLDGVVTCSAGAIADARGSVPIARGGSYDFSFSTTAASGTVVFRTEPPDSSYSLRFLAEGRPLDSAHFQVSRWGLPLFEPVKSEWHDKTEFGWMDGWAPPVLSTAPVVSLGRVLVSRESPAWGTDHP